MVTRGLGGTIRTCFLFSVILVDVHKTAVLVRLLALPEFVNFALFSMKVFIMYRGLENLRVTVIVAILCVAGVSSGKTVSLSELPQAVRDTIEREAKGFGVENIDLKKAADKATYEVKAESADFRQSQLVVAGDGSLISKNERIRAEDLPAKIAQAVKESVGDVVFFTIQRTVTPA